MDYKLFEIVLDYIYSDSIIFCKLVSKEWYNIIYKKNPKYKIKLNYDYLTTQKLLDYSEKNFNLIKTSKFYLDIIVNSNVDTIKWLHNNKLLNTCNIFKILFFSSDDTFIYFKNNLLDKYIYKLSSKQKNEKNLYILNNIKYSYHCNGIDIKYCK